MRLSVKDDKGSLRQIFQKLGKASILIWSLAITIANLDFFQVIILYLGQILIWREEKISVK